MKINRTLALGFVAVLAVFLAGCGGGGGSPTVTPPPTTPTNYGALSYAVLSQCEYLVGAISIGSASQSSVSSAALKLCQARTNQLAQSTGSSPITCSQPRTFGQCAAFAAGENDNRDCWISGTARGSRGEAQLDARNVCERELGGAAAGANCRVLNSACTSDTSSPLVGQWTPSTPPPPPPPPPGGLNRDQVGLELGTTSTTGRGHNLLAAPPSSSGMKDRSCSPSVDVVSLPSEAGTVTLEYNAFSFPDRFVE